MRHQVELPKIYKVSRLGGIDMESTEELCRGRLLDAPGRIRCLISGCTALGQISRIGGGCILIQASHKHPALGLGPVVFDVFGTGFQVRVDTKLMFQDDNNVVLSLPSELEFHQVPAKYTLTKEPVLALAMSDGDESNIHIIGINAGGFVFETNQRIETRIKNTFTLKGKMKDHTLQGEFAFERLDSNMLTCGVVISNSDRIQTALWHTALRDLVA